MEEAQKQQREGREREEARTAETPVTDGGGSGQKNPKKTERRKSEIDTEGEGKNIYSVPIQAKERIYDDHSFKRLR